MTCQLIPVELTAEQKGQVYGILSVGCDRETAANFVGCTIADIGCAMRQDAAFAASVRRTEAAAELSHMRNVQQAAKDEKHWRASVWWLERRSPERFGARSAGTVTTRHLKAFLQLLGESLNEDIQNAEDRARVVARFKQVRAFVGQLADDLWDAPATLDDDARLMESDLEVYGDSQAADESPEFYL